MGLMDVHGGMPTILDQAGLVVVGQFDTAYLHDDQRTEIAASVDKMQFFEAPSGSVWIDLSAEGYGIQGTPKPGKVSRATFLGLAAAWARLLAVRAAVKA